MSGPKPRTIAERFWHRVHIAGPDDCWEWQGSRKPLGYGSMRGADGRTTAAHRVAYVLTHPNELPLTSDDHICHHCDNPPCCNPAHLYRGNYRTNNADKVQRGRQLSGPAMSAILTPHVQRGDNHWTRRMPERINNPKGRPAWNRGHWKPHGTMARYQRGCHCDACREANTVYKRFLRNRKAS